MHRPTQEVPQAHLPALHHQILMREQLDEMYRSHLGLWQAHPMAYWEQKAPWTRWLLIQKWLRPSDIT